MRYASDPQRNHASHINLPYYPLRLASASLCLGPAQQPAIPSTGFAGLDQYRASRIAVFTDDFGQLARYRAANAALKPPAPGENRVVFFGDSITDIWKLEDSFPGKPYLNRGISGQTTPQMLVRFRQDVIDLHPKVVVILAGTNDIAGNTGPMRLEDIEANYASMAELARRTSHRRGIFFGDADTQLHAEIAGFLRAALAGENPGAEPLAEETIARRNDLIYLDYFSRHGGRQRHAQGDSGRRRTASRTPPGSRSWRRWRRRRLRRRWRRQAVIVNSSAVCIRRASR